MKCLICNHHETDCVIGNDWTYDFFCGFCAEKAKKMAIKDRAITSHDMSPLGFNSITHALFELSLLELLSMKLNSRQKLYDKNYIKGLEMAKAYVDNSQRRERI